MNNDAQFDDTAVSSYRDCQQQINHILDEFCFDEVATVMHALGWKWTKKGSQEPEFPNIQRMMKTARFLLERVSEFECGGTSSSGGFLAEKRPDGLLFLTFYVCRIDGNMDEIE